MVFRMLAHGNGGELSRAGHNHWVKFAPDNCVGVPEPNPSHWRRTAVLDSWLTSMAQIF